jgi:hypothetical protein
MIRTRILASAAVLACGLTYSILPAHAAATDYRFELVGKPRLSGQKDIVQVRLVHATPNFRMPCDTVVASVPDHQLSSGLVPIRTPVPCKGMMPGCADMLGCAVTAGLPAHVTATAHKLIWTSVAYRAVVSWHEGVSIKPYLDPPITI